MQIGVEVQWNICVQCGRHISSGTYFSNVKCICTSAHGHIICCIELIYKVFNTDIVVTYVHMK